ncbi:cold-regulated 413 plasma membrane protein 2-like isoform X2 [Olea europaea var. sylvestris]|uniref:cold-regulated 413 plasma membrane protein 2-like isoform X2 n=1 Tax=Olea europaea var. sylvestris TaxID=158386 RepID=UPI000C1D8662|nr:cold-regulated 413 plasma membrane protein 2-like isoform X2 [Olea europaea var. sylvestris]
MDKIVGKKRSYLAMKTDSVAANELISSDLKEIGNAVKKLANHAVKLGSLGFGTIFLEWIASFAAMGEIGKWIALIAVVLRLFFPRRFPDWLELPGALILLIVVAPSFFAGTIRDSWIGILICLVIGCYLLQEHIRASGGFRNSFTKSNGISNTIGIVILLVYPVWALILYIL